MKAIKRNSNIELLRIISILLIIISHYSVHSSIVTNNLPMGFNRLLFENAVLGNIGVIIFILITGYYLISNEKPFKLKKFLNLYLEVLFYSSIFYFIFILLGREKITVLGLLHNLIPISHASYWFMSVYLIMYLFSFYINKFLNSLKREEHFRFILISLIILTIGLITNSLYYITELLQFIIFYSIGGYLKKYPDNKLNQIKKNYIILFITIILLIFSTILIDLLSKKYAVFIGLSSYYYSRNSILSILFSISIFNIFVLRKERSNKIINYISQYVLGVYLISDNNYVRSVLWSDILRVPDYVYSRPFIIHMIFSVVIVFVVCLVIEFVRKNTIERLYMPLIEKICKNRE